MDLFQTKQKEEQTLINFNSQTKTHDTKIIMDKQFNPLIGIV